MKETMFDRWATPLASTLPLKDLEHAMGESQPLRIGVDAEHFVRRFAGKEPLNGALGGDPYLLEDKIMLELTQLRKMSCETIFYFHGVKFGPASETIAAANKAAEINSSAFTRYEENTPRDAIEIFRNNDFPNISPILSWLKVILAKHAVPFVTAPFSAYGQMVEAFNQGSIDMCFASTEVFLFGAGQIIIGMDFKVENHRSAGSNGHDTTSSVVNVDASTFRLLDLEILASAHLRAPEVLVKDAMILAGSSKLPIFQPWRDASGSTNFGFAEAVSLLSRWEGNIYALIDSSAIEKKTIYWDQYMQVATAIQYMPVLHHINEVAPVGRRKDVPNDLQTALGLHLPDELNYYLFTGIIEPKMLNWLNSGKITIEAPFEGGDDTYKKLIKNTLHDWRRQNYSLLVSNFNRYFQRRPVTTEYWFELSSENAFTDETPAVDRSPLAHWRMKEGDLASKALQLKMKPRSLEFAMTSLTDDSFAAKTVNSKPRDSDEDVLKTGDELISNVIWRSLFVRGYLDGQHKLTSWGKAAQAALSKVGQDRAQSESVFVAVELLRAKVLSPSAIFAASQTDDADKRYTEFMSKVMCVGSLVHQSKGYSGPLSRSLLAFHASVSAIRTSLRDLLEVTLVNLLLWGEGERARPDYTELARDLPFQGRFSCGLGIFISTYLDQYHERIREVSSAADLNDALKSRMQTFVAHSQVGPSFVRINQIWDALMAAVRAGGDVVEKEDKKHFEEVDAWFARRRPGTTAPIIANGT